MFDNQNGKTLNEGKQAMMLCMDLKNSLEKMRESLNITLDEFQGGLHNKADRGECDDLESN